MVRLRNRRLLSITAIIPALVLLCLGDILLFGWTATVTFGGAAPRWLLDMIPGCADSILHPVRIVIASERSCGSTEWGSPAVSVSAVLPRYEPSPLGIPAQAALQGVGPTTVLDFVSLPLAATYMYHTCEMYSFGAYSPNDCGIACQAWVDDIPQHSCTGFVASAELNALNAVASFLTLPFFLLTVLVPVAILIVIIKRRSKASSIAPGKPSSAALAR